jgi:hypothetical protein
MFRKLAYSAIAAAAVLGLGAFSAVAADASTAVKPAAVSTHTYYTGEPDLTAGYFATSDDGNFMTHIQGYLGSNGTDSLQQLSDGFSDGQTLSLCDTSTGDALNVGDVVNPGGTKSVGYHIGTYTGTPNNSNGDPCEDGELTGGLGFFPQLQNVPITDTVVAQILQYTSKGETCHKGDVLFEARDITANPGVWYSSGCLKALGSGLYNEASAFTTKDSTIISAPAVNYLDTFAHLTLADSAGTHGSLQATSTWTAYAVDATANGKASDALLEEVGPFVNDHFDTMVGSAVAAP